MSNEKKTYQAVLATLPSVNKKKTDWSGVFFIVSFLFVHIAWFIIYWAFVNINSLLMAFQDPIDGSWSTENVISIWNDITGQGAGSLGLSMRNTFIFAIRDVIFIFFHLAICYFLYKKIKGYRAFQIILYLPGILSSVAMATAFKYFIQSDGPIGQVLKLVGMVDEYGTPFTLLRRTDTAFGTVLFYTIWMGWGGNMLLLCGALARVPVEVLESARLDGVGSGRELFQIILPLVWPTMSTLFLLKMTTIFTASGPVLILTNGAYDTSNLAFWIYERVTKYGTAGQYFVSAAGFIFTCVGVPLVMFLRWLVERVPVVEY